MPDQPRKWSDVAAEFADIGGDEPLNMDDPSVKLIRTEVALDAAHRGMAELHRELNEAYERIEQLTQALAPFAHYDDDNDFADVSDKEIAVEFGITAITFGDFRRAKEALDRIGHNSTPIRSHQGPNPADLRAKIRAAGREAASKHREALDMLKECEGQNE